MRFCLFEGCEKKLPGQNKTGYCLEHRYQNPEVRAASIKRLNIWQENNPERVKEYRSEWANSNPEKVAAALKRYKEAHPTAQAQSTARWRENNPELSRRLSAEYSSARRARILNQFVEDVDRSLSFKNHNGFCYLCGIIILEQSWHLDHIIPLSKGGEHSYANTAPTHAKCNERKSDLLLEEVLNGNFSPLYT